MVKLVGECSETMTELRSVQSKNSSVQVSKKGLPNHELSTCRNAPFLQKFGARYYDLNVLITLREPGALFLFETLVAPAPPTTILYHTIYTILHYLSNSFWPLKHKQPQAHNPCVRRCRAYLGSQGGTGEPTVRVIYNLFFRPQIRF